MAIHRGQRWCGAVCVLVTVMTPVVARADPPSGLIADLVCSANGRLPPNVVARGVLASVIGDMLERSATFRDQCQTLAGARWLRVQLAIDGLMSHTFRVGETNIRRFSEGATFADVEIAAAVDYPAVVAHEFEHLIEQIEGHDLERLSRRGGSGVVRTSLGAFETERAIAAGLAVKREMKRRRKN